VVGAFSSGSSSVGWPRPVGSASQRQAEARIVAQGIEIIGVLIAARDREHTGTQNVIEAMDHPRRVTRIGDARSKLPADPHRALRQQQNAAVRGQPATVERGCDLLAANRWKRKSRCAIIAPAGVVRGINCLAEGLVWTPIFLLQSNRLRHSRQPSPRRGE
jgi:hypothetical protein